jgi:hypothetical protein
MKYSAIVFLFLMACGGNRNSLPKLLHEQKLLKDSANNINERIGIYLRKGVYDSAEIQKSQLPPVYARLRRIQSLIDNFPGIK